VRGRSIFRLLSDLGSGQGSLMNRRLMADSAARLLKEEDQIFGLWALVFDFWFLVLGTLCLVLCA
jgi:hypothetical protein